MYDVVALGELLLDFTPGGETKEGTVLFERNPGGAPGNVMALMAKPGKKTALIAKVGEDQFGRFLTGILENIDVDTKGIDFANAAGSLATLKKGAIPAMPSISAIEECILLTPKLIKV